MEGDYTRWFKEMNEPPYDSVMSDFYRQLLEKDKVLLAELKVSPFGDTRPYVQSFDWGKIAHEQHEEYGQD